MASVSQTNASRLRLRAMLGDYPITRAIKNGEIESSRVVLDFAPVKVAQNAFKRVVRGLEFDVAELAIVTFLMAKAYGKPLVLLPAVMFGRAQHPFLIYNAERGPLSPDDLAGKRVAIRSYSVTTVTWVRGILADDYGVDLDRVHWVTFEEPHVAEFRDPPNLERAREGTDMLSMLLAGEVDAAVAGAIPTDPRLKPLIPDPVAAAREWQAKHKALMLNHLVVVNEALSREHPDAVREVYRMLLESRKAAGVPAPGETDTSPFGVETNRRNLEVAIDYVYRQKLIPRRFSVDELFDDVTRGLNG